jgi:hypothetical protein
MDTIATAGVARNINPNLPAPKPVVVGELALNSRDVLRVTLGEYEGRRTIDCRKFYKTDDGVLRPSPKGLTMAIDRLPALADFITDALNRARAEGLLPGSVAR